MDGTLIISEIFLHQMFELRAKPLLFELERGSMGGKALSEKVIFFKETLKDNIATYKFRNSYPVTQVAVVFPVLILRWWD